MLNTIRNGLGSVCTAVGTAAKATGSGIKNAAIWCTNSKTKCVLLGTAAVTAVVIGAYVRNPAAAKALAASIENWGRNTAWPRIATTFQETIVPTAQRGWTIVRGAVYTNGKVTALGGGLIGATVALVIRAIGTALYRFVRPDQTAAERHAAIARLEAVEARHRLVLHDLDAIVSARNTAVAERNAARAERNEAVEARGAAVAGQNSAVAERDAAVAELAQAQERHERDVAACSRIFDIQMQNQEQLEAAVATRDAAVAELTQLREQCAPVIALLLQATRQVPEANIE